MRSYEKISSEIKDLVLMWEPKLTALSDEIITQRTNSQGRTIRQIVGHMVDSASNNLHRIIHLQYQNSPVSFPDYANLGINDKWIAIQNYQEEPWDLLVQIWKYTHLHISYVIRQVDMEKKNATWVSALEESISLENMIIDFPRHFNLHVDEINSLIEEK